MWASQWNIMFWAPSGTKDPNSKLNGLLRSLFFYFLFYKELSLRDGRKGKCFAVYTVYISNPDGYSRFFLIKKRKSRYII